MVIKGRTSIGVDAVLQAQRLCTEPTELSRFDFRRRGRTRSTHRTDPYITVAMRSTWKIHVVGKGFAGRRRQRWTGVPEERVRVVQVVELDWWKTSVNLFLSLLCFFGRQWRGWRRDSHLGRPGRAGRRLWCMCARCPPYRKRTTNHLPLCHTPLTRRHPLPPDRDPTEYRHRYRKNLCVRLQSRARALLRRRTTQGLLTS